MPKRDASTPPEALAQRLLALCRPHLKHRRGPFVLGLSGLQGSGKTHVAAALVRQGRRHGIAVSTLSLDDVYLGRRARMQRATTVHPLLRTRGVPGTHDLALLARVLAALPRASPRSPVALPRFDKARDTRRPPSRWPRVVAPPDLLVLEGWCVGLPPQAPRALHRPVNALERDEDPDGRWRGFVNDALEAMQPIWQQLDRLAVLQAPDWPTACRWRAMAERTLRARGAPRAMDRGQLRRFMQHFERLSRHALQVLPGRADLCMELDAAHRWVRVQSRRPRAPETGQGASSRSR